MSHHCGVHLAFQAGHPMDLEYFPERPGCLLFRHGGLFKISFTALLNPELLL